MVVEGGSVLSWRRSQRLKQVQKLTRLRFLLWRPACSVSSAASVGTLSRFPLQATSGPNIGGDAAMPARLGRAPAAARQLRGGINGAVGLARPGRHRRAASETLLGSGCAFLEGLPC